MKFLADECCDAPLVEALRQDGHDVLYAIESLRGAADDELLARFLGTTVSPDGGQRLWGVSVPLSAARAWDYPVAP